MRTRAERHAIMLAARELFQRSNVVAVAALTRGDVATLTKARREFKRRSLGLKMMPNSLCHKALENTDRAFMQGLFVGSTIVCYPLEEIEEGVLAQNLLASFDENPTMHLMGGALDNVPLYPADFTSLAKMPSQYDLRVDVAQALKAPLRRVALTLKAPSKRVATALNAPNRRLGRALTASLKKQQGEELF